MRLRLALGAAALLGLGGALAPGYAEDTAPEVAIAAPPIADPALPRFEPQVDTGAALTIPQTDTDDGGQAWQPVGGGMASWYGAELAGHRTASGERFNPAELTAAHRTLPLGTRVRVTYHGESVVVRINDRGPFVRGRVIDLSRAAAEEIGLRRAGSGKVALAVLDDTPDSSSQ
uniref:septal ring lytic transglycosylase RlpA family protein n=1 Tax=Altererythrobacter segetis TaxID=1104773 RepID=UPI00140B8F1B|nr:septal ring lytic transglycosylase RlpA family protein [Altererythrobacter segetis]